MGTYMLHNAAQACLISFSFILYLTVWGVEPVVTHQTSWLESTGVLWVLLNAYNNVGWHKPRCLDVAIQP